jgi:CheY-like chemotaxis protein
MSEERAGRERRAWVRYRCEPEADCFLAGNGLEAPWPARVRDISAVGVRLLVDRRFDPGTVLGLQSPQPSHPVQELRVVRLSEEPGGGWAVSGAFVKQLAERELKAWLTSPPKPGVLIVDDDEGVREVLAVVLADEGYPVWLAGSSREAIELYRQHRAEIGLVLLDVWLLDPDGVRTFAALLQIDPQVRCCFMTGGGSPYGDADLRDLGAVEVLQKPFRLATLREVVARAVGSPTTQPA